MAHSEIRIRPRTIARICAVSIALLVAAHLASQVLRFGFGWEYQMGMAEEVYLGGEATIPNWVSTLLLLACGLTLLTIAAGKRGDRFYRHWLALGATFVAMSLDESAALHDLSAPFFAGLFHPLARTIGGPFLGLENKPGYAWMFPGVAFCIVVGISYLRFLRDLPRSSRLRFIVAGIVYVGGAVGFEALGGWYSGLHGSKNPYFVALMTCEETLEMVGASLFLFALLDYAEREFGAVRIVLGTEPARVDQRAGTTAIASTSSISPGRASADTCTNVLAGTTSPK